MGCNIAWFLATHMEVDEAVAVLACLYAARQSHAAAGVGEPSMLVHACTCTLEAPGMLIEKQSIAPVVGGALISSTGAVRSVKFVHQCVCQVGWCVQPWEHISR